MRAVMREVESGSVGGEIAAVQSGVRRAVNVSLPFYRGKVTLLSGQDDSNRSPFQCSSPPTVFPAVVDVCVVVCVCLCACAPAFVSMYLFVCLALSLCVFVHACTCGGKKKKKKEEQALPSCRSRSSAAVRAH